MKQRDKKSGRNGTMTQTKLEQFKAYADFIAKKLERYREKHPNSYPHYTTVWRWKKKFLAESKRDPRAFKCYACEFDQDCPVDKGGKCFWQKKDNVGD